MSMLTRFAPSNTNQNPDVKKRGLHIGNFRTLLMNFIPSLKYGSHINIRIEDTDEARSNLDSLKCIIRDTEWAGIKFQYPISIVNDQAVQPKAIGGRPHIQSQRKDFYKQCLSSIKNGLFEKDGATWFKMPNAKISYYDGVFGAIARPKPEKDQEPESFILIKSSGMPSFYWAMTCDDFEMGITDVIRGREHINTTFKQLALIEAAGFREPNFYHLPLLLNPDGSKMSKRQTTGQVSLWEFVEDGYVFDAIANYLLSLGWGKYHKAIESAKTIAFDLRVHVSPIFDLEDISKVDAKFDYSKLKYINKKYLSSSKAYFVNQLIKYANLFHQETYDKLLANGKWEDVIKAFFGNISTLSEAFPKWLFHKPEITKERTIYLSKYPLADKVLDVFITKMYEDQKVDDVIVEIAKQLNISTNEVVQPIRLGLTGTNIAPKLNDIINIIGFVEAKNRLIELKETLPLIEAACLI